MMGKSGGAITLFCSVSTQPYRSKPFLLTTGLRVVSRNIALSSAVLKLPLHKYLDQDFDNRVRFNDFFASEMIFLSSQIISSISCSFHFSISLSL